MRIQYRIVYFLAFLAGWQMSVGQEGKSNFVYLNEVEPAIVLDIRYYTSDNFVGQRIDGYKAPVALITKEAGEALKSAQRELEQEGFGLKIFDAYRPQKGVNHFIRWSKVASDTLTKSKYYPEIRKSSAFKLGYIASKSGHSRGSTVDLTIVNLETKKEIDMGSGWDYFGKISWHSTDQINSEQRKNRLKLKNIMSKYGFKSYSKEWWHYTLRDEPFPSTYFDFDIE